MDRREKVPRRPVGTRIPQGNDKAEVRSTGDAEWRCKRAARCKRRAKLWPPRGTPAPRPTANRVAGRSSRGRAVAKKAPRGPLPPPQLVCARDTKGEGRMHGAVLLPAHLHARAGVRSEGKTREHPALRPGTHTRNVSHVPTRKPPARRSRSRAERGPGLPWAGSDLNFPPGHRQTPQVPTAAWCPLALP